MLGTQVSTYLKGPLAKAFEELKEESGLSGYALLERAVREMLERGGKITPKPAKGRVLTVKQLMALAEAGYTKEEMLEISMGQVAMPDLDQSKSSPTSKGPVYHEPTNERVRVRRRAGQHPAGAASADGSGASAPRATPEPRGRRGQRRGRSAT